MEDIEAKTKTLTEASGKLAEKMYAEQGAAAEGAAPGGESSAESTATDDDVVDAEFEEVKDDK